MRCTTAPLSKLGLKWQRCDLKIQLCWMIIIILMESLLMSQNINIFLSLNCLDSRAYLHTIVTKEASACHLLSVHNVAHQENKYFSSNKRSVIFLFISSINNWKLPPYLWIQEWCMHKNIGLGRFNHTALYRRPLFYGSFPLFPAPCKVLTLLFLHLY